MEHIVIIGNGIAGITAARWIRKLSDHRITVISSESDYFFSRTALMYVYMGHMRWQDILPYDADFYKKNRIELIYNHIQSINFYNKILQATDGASYKYDRLILATGSKSNYFNWEGQELEGVCGLYTKQDLDKIEFLSEGIKSAVIVGGGLIGVELAEMLHSRNIKVVLLARDSAYWSAVLPAEEAALVSRHILEHQIDLRHETGLLKINANENGKVASILTDKGHTIPCEFVGITTGVSPNIDFLRNTPLACDKGILVNNYLETNIPNVYAIGDCVQLREPIKDRKAIEAVWYTGSIMGETLAYTICVEPKPYEQLIWFNSAKFFDIEYQVYGLVPNKIEYPLDTLYWESSSGKKSIRLIFDEDTKIIKGFNLMGFRFRQEVCEQWIRKKTPLENVVANIRLAFFEPEFYSDVAPKLLKIYKLKFGKKTSLRSSGSLNAVLRFFKKN
ncbi:MAG: FAD/NAD(P)-binding oxidoreductase [Saprospiraceae bacterium]|nr:NAD(P)/FAD-dependent oxidoreductase [Saprospiraceae bacterium]MBK9727604.1 NAD(P)/FAD-dependent oxidoreductase [Saprospiraceae bacterium]